MKAIVLGIIASILFTACQSENRVFSENQELSPGVEWYKKDKRTFRVPIEDGTIDYSMSLMFRFAEGYPYPNVLVKVTEISPSGKEVVFHYDLKVRDENNNYIGEAALDIWDSEHLVESKKEFKEAGTYTYIIEQDTPIDPLPNAMEIGLLLDKKKVS